MTTFVDMSSHPEQYAHTYKISAVDTCGNESPLSPYHRTMYLGISQGNTSGEVILEWTHYEDESGQFQPLKYYIYRKNVPFHPFYSIIDSIPANLNNYNDHPPAGINYYFITTHRDACYPSSIDKEVGGPYDYSLSNIDDYQINETPQLKIKVDIAIFPNPMKNTAELTYYNPNNEDVSLKIIDLTGKTVFEKTGLPHNKYIIEKGNLKPGTYMVVVTGETFVYKAKLIVE
jgi:hypothetical protein